MATLSTNATEKSTYKITCAFTDDDGTAVNPASLTWTLVNDAGTVVNSRLDVSVVSPTTPVDIILSGDDLDISTYGKQRLLTLTATYNSTAGSGLPLKSEVSFLVDNLKMVT